MKPRKPYPRSRLNKIIKIAKQIRNKELYGNSLNKWNLLQHVKSTQTKSSYECFILPILL